MLPGQSGAGGLLVNGVFAARNSHSPTHVLFFGTDQREIPVISRRVFVARSIIFSYRFGLRGFYFRDPK